jgi:hypothetical protein
VAAAAGETASDSDAARLVVRLLNRKGPWFRVAKRSIDAPSAAASSSLGGAASPGRHSHSTLPLPIIDCHYLQLLRDLHSNLPVIAANFCHNDSVAPGQAPPRRHGASACRGWPTRASPWAGRCSSSAPSNCCAGARRPSSAARQAPLARGDTVIKCWYFI